MKITVVATMKNEGAFLIDWAAHYLGLGATHLYIATNDCADPTAAMVKRLAALGLATHHATGQTQHGGIQRSAYRQSRRYESVTGADWILICDSDEFLAIRGGGLPELIALSPGADVIGLSWRNFTNTGQWTYEDRPVTEQFTTLHQGQRRAYTKYLARPSSLSRIGIHRPELRDDLGRAPVEVMAGGAPWVQRGLVCRADISAAQMNHYPLRSLESFLVKRDRGRVNHTGVDMGLDYWARFSGPGREDHLIRRHDATTAPWRARLMADSVLAELHAQAVAWHRAKISELLSQTDWLQFCKGAMEITRQSGAARGIDAGAGTSPDLAPRNRDFDTDFA